MVTTRGRFFLLTGAVFSLLFGQLLPAFAVAATPKTTVPITALPTDIPSLLTAQNQAILNASKSKGGNVNDEWAYSTAFAKPSGNNSVNCDTANHPSGSIYQYYMSTLGANPPVQPGDFEKEWGCDYIIIYDTAYWYVGALDDDWTKQFLPNIIEYYNKASTTDLSTKQANEQEALDWGYHSVIPELANAYAAFQLLAAYAAMPAVQQDLPLGIPTTKLTCATSAATMAQDCALDMFVPTNSTNSKRIHAPVHLTTALQDGNNAVSLFTDDGHAYPSTSSFYTDFAQLMNVFTDPSSALATAADATTLNAKVLAAVQNFDATNGSVSATAEADNRCGSAASLINPAQQLRYGICSFVDYSNQLIDSLLVSSVGLLGVTSGIYGNFNGSQAVNPSNFTVNGWNTRPLNSDADSFFGDILPASVSTPFQQVMVDNNTAIGRVVIDTTNLVLRVLNALLILAFLMIALANILQVQLNTYNLRKLLPGLILGYVLAFASPFLMRASLELVSRVGQGVFEISRSVVSSDTAATGLTTQNDFQYFATAISNVRGANGTLCLTDDASGKPNVKGGCGNAFEALTAGTPGSGQQGINDSRVFQQAVLGAAVAMGAVLVLVLGFLLMFRVFVFAILVPIAPLAVFSKFFPPIGVIWNRWWKTMSSWILMPIPIMFCLLIAFIYFAAANQPTSTGTGNNDQGLLAAIVNYAAAVGILFAAIKLPFSMAGEAKAYLEKWNALGRGAYNNTIGAAVTAGGYGSVKNNLIPAFKDRMKANNEALSTRGPVNARVTKYAEKLGENTKVSQDQSKARVERAKLNAQQDLEKDEGFVKKRAEATAALEHIKETTGQLNDTMKEEVRMRKNNNAAYRKEFNDAKNERILRQAQAEESETERLKAYLATLDDNPATPGVSNVAGMRVKRALLQVEAEKEAQGKFQDKSTRSAEKKEMELATARKSLESRLKNGFTTNEEFDLAIKDAETLSTEHPDATAKAQYGTVLTDLRTARTAGAAAFTPTQRTAVQAKYDAVKKGLGVREEVQTQKEGRIGKRDGKAIGEDASFQFDNGMLPDNLANAKHADTFVRILAGQGGHLSNEDDAMGAWAGFAKAVRSQDYNATDLTSMATALDGIKTGTGLGSLAGTNEGTIARRKVGDADRQVRASLVTGLRSAAPSERDKYAQNFGFRDAAAMLRVTTLDGYLRHMATITDRNARGRVSKLLDSSGALNTIKASKAAAGGGVRSA